MQFPVDPLTGVRNILNQNDKYRIRILTCYLVFVVSCLPVWWVFMNKNAFNVVPIEGISLMKSAADSYISEPLHIIFNLNSKLLIETSRTLFLIDSFKIEVKTASSTSTSNDKDYTASVFDNTFLYNLNIIELESDSQSDIIECQDRDISIKTFRKTITEDYLTDCFEKILKKYFIKTAKTTTANSINIKLKFTLLLTDEAVVVVDDTNTENNDADDIWWSYEKIFKDILKVFKKFHNLKAEFGVKRTFKLTDEDFTDDLNLINIQNFISGSATRRHESNESGKIFNFVICPRFDSETETESKHKDKIIVIPDWGVINIINTHTHTHSNSRLQLDDSMKIFADTLSLLFGFQPSSNGITITDIERDLWIYMMKKHFIAKSSSTLALLLNPTTVASLEISREYLKTKLIPAIEAVEMALKNDTDFEQFKTAFSMAQDAVFDPSLVGEARFPDEHKFAVYLPLYLPLLLPVIATLFKEIKSRINKNKIKKKVNNMNKNMITVEGENIKSE